MTDEDWGGLPYAAWLEAVIQALVLVDPECIAVKALDSTGRTYTSYFNTSQTDRAQMISAMVDDDRLEWVKNNRESIMAILTGEDEEEDPDEEEDGAVDGWTTIS